MFVRRARRGIDDEIVQVAPFDVFEKLLDQAVLFGTAPYDRVGCGGKEEADGHDGEAGDQPEEDVWMVDEDRPMRSGMEGPQMSTSIIPVYQFSLDLMIRGAGGTHAAK